MKERPLSEAALDVVAIGNAIVDVISQESDEFIASHALVKGGMQLIDADQAEALYVDMASGREISGGSAANTLAGMAALGGKCGFIGQVADDQLGRIFAHDIRALGIRYETAVSSDGPPTARCLIMVTPDAQRTMNTFLGASQFLPADALNLEMIRSARILYLEGYLWDPEQPRAAMRDAIAAAKDAGREVAFTLSDAFVIERHREDFISLIEDGLIDILFSNETEICSLAQTQDCEKAIARFAGKLPTLIVTRSEKGAIAIQGGTRHEVDAAPVERVVDTTGAGDLFAAGFLTGYVRGKEPATCLKLGAIAAAEVISHYGARPEADLKELAGDLLA